MTTAAPAHSIVVGVDDSGPSRVALLWACQEATRRGRPLHLVHVYLISTVYAGVGVYTSLTGGEVARLSAVAEQTLAEALAFARGNTEGVDITAATHEGSAAAALVADSSAADLLVVGARGLGALRSALLGSVSTQVAMHSRAPVVVIKDLAETPQPRSGVTVGIDGHEDSQACLEFAFTQASSRGTSLDVVHAWASDRGKGKAAATDALGADYELEPRRQLLIDTALAGWTEKYPDVEVRQSVVHAHAVPALVEHSATAQLLVVGSRGRGGFAGLLLGSVSHGVLQHATCPVAVVPGVDHR